ncbi:hypothetical protein PQX77_002344 [Marasmius sp. AFHP31]|nr:hypothetical protein PQX77_002344 [Marasmius sp. AFHP31]
MGQFETDDLGFGLVVQMRAVGGFQARQLISTPARHTCLVDTEAFDCIVLLLSRPAKDHLVFGKGVARRKQRDSSDQPCCVEVPDRFFFSYPQKDGRFSTTEIPIIRVEKWEDVVVDGDGVGDGVYHRAGCIVQEMRPPDDTSTNLSAVVDQATIPVIQCPASRNRPRPHISPAVITLTTSLSAYIRPGRYPGSPQPQKVSVRVKSNLEGFDDGTLN